MREVVATLKRGGTQSFSAWNSLRTQLSLHFLDWLEKMVQPRLKDRFANAQQALNALIPLNLTRCPQVKFSHQIQDFKATHLGEKVKQTITIENPIPDTLLEGFWEVVSHPHDPPHTPKSHPWISITPRKFLGNYKKFDIEVNTSHLMADKLYKRQLVLHTNGEPETHTLTVKVQTAAIPIERREAKSYASLIWAFLTSEITTVTIIGVIPWIFVTLASHNIVFWNVPEIANGISGALVFGTVEAIAGAVIGAVISGIYNLFEQNKQTSKSSNSYSHDSWQSITTAYHQLV